MHRFYVVAAMVLLLALLALAWANNHAQAPFLVVVLTFGALGAVIREHVDLRLASQALDFQPRSMAGTCFCPVAGAMLALILTTLFLSGVISGDLFPQFKNSKDSFVSMKAVLRGAIVFSTNADFYKMLAWSLIAGYSEKMILSKLEALSGQSKPAP